MKSTKFERTTSAPSVVKTTQITPYWKITRRAPIIWEGCKLLSITMQKTNCNRLANSWIELQRKNRSLFRKGGLFIWIEIHHQSFYLFKAKFRKWDGEKWLKKIIKNWWTLKHNNCDNDDKLGLTKKESICLANYILNLNIFT